MLEFSLKEKKYGENFRISDVHFKIKDGETLCLLGHNGAGKTTIIKSLFGLIDFDGQMKLDNKEINFNSAKDIDYFKKNVCYISDELNIFPFLTPNELFLLIKNTYNVSIDTDFLDKLVYLFELSDYLNLPISSLSHGNKKKTQIVAQLFKQPRFVIFDEPTNGLDPDMIIVLRKVIKFLKEHKTAVLLSTHNLDFGNDLYDKVIILRNGKVKLNTTKKNLYKEYGQINLEETYTQVNQDYYKQVDELLNGLY